MKDKTISTLQEVLSYLDLANSLNDYSIEEIRNNNIEKVKTYLFILSDYLFKAYNELDGVIDNELNKDNIW